MIATGAQVNISVAGPKVSSTDFHSNAEMLVANATESDMVEGGWIVSSGSSTPHFFVDYWKNHQIYGSSGFVTASGAPVKNNMTLTPGGSLTLSLEYQNSQWQIYYNNKEVGYFPESLWGSGAFTHTKFVDVFGEVEGTNTKQTTSQMGNGLLGTKSNSAYFSHYSLIGSTAASHLTVAGPSGAAAKVFNVGNISSEGFHYGGPGF